MMVQEDELPQASVAVHTMVVVPVGKVSLAKVLVRLKLLVMVTAPPHKSEAVALNSVPLTI